MALIEITFGEEDGRAIAASSDVAMERTEEWAKHIQETATTLCNEQLESVIRTNEP